MKISCQILFDKEHGTLLRTLEPVSFSINGKEYTVPVGFISDGMSIPRLYWRFLSPPINGVTLVPSIIHDWLYKNHICTRREADIWYYHALRFNGYPRWKAGLVFIGVRIGGYPHWGGLDNDR